MMAGVVDQLRVLKLAPGIELERPVRQHVGETDDRIQRRAQFMTHGGDEPDLCRIGAFGFRPRGLDRAVLRFPFADIAEDGNHLTLAGPELAGEAAHVHPSKLAGAAPDAKLQ